MTQGCMPKLTHPMYGYAKQNKNEIIGVRVSERLTTTLSFQLKTIVKLLRVSFNHLMP